MHLHWTWSPLFRNLYYFNYQACEDQLWDALENEERHKEEPDDFDWYCNKNDIS